MGMESGVGKAVSGMALGNGIRDGSLLHIHSKSCWICNEEPSPIAFSPLEISAQDFDYDYVLDRFKKLCTGKRFIDVNHVNASAVKQTLNHSIS